MGCIVDCHSEKGPLALCALLDSQGGPVGQDTVHLGGQKTKVQEGLEDFRDSSEARELGHREPL